VVCTNCSLSNADTTNSNPIIKLEKSRHFTLGNSQVSGPALGVEVGAGAVETKIVDSEFARNKTGAISIASGATQTLVEGNQFSDTCQGATNTYNGIDVAANATDFKILGNWFRSFSSANKCKYDIAIQSGTGNQFIVAHNVTPTTSYATGKILNSASGGTQSVVDNIP